MTRNTRESAAFAAKVVLVSAVEAGAVFVWLWLTLDHHLWGLTGPWWGLAILAAGETFETFMLIHGVDGRVRKRWGPPTSGPAGRAHYRRVKRTVALAGIVEIGIWLLWFHTESWLGPVVAAAVLLVL